MGKNQSTAGSWSTDDWTHGTSSNGVSFEQVLDEAQKIPQKYFGGQALENDPSMHQLQHDFLAFDETLKKFFRIGKTKSSISDYSSIDGSDAYQVRQQTSRDSEQNHEYLEPISIIGMDSSMTNSQRYLYWRCGNCMMENKIGERICQRCGEMETRF